MNNTNNNTNKRLTKANSTKAQRREQQRRNIAAKQGKARTTTIVVPARRNPMRKVRANNNKDPYIICRLNPYASKGSLGIPDGNQTRKIVVDHRQLTTITFGSSGTVGIVFAPCMPAPIWVYPYDNTTAINGTTATNNVALNACVPVTVAEWGSFGIVYNNTAGNYDNVGSIYGANRARIVTGAWQVMYLGTSLTDSGMIRATSSALSIDTPVPNVSGLTVQNWAGAGFTSYNANQVMVRLCNSPMGTNMFTGSSNTYDTTMTRLKKGAHGLLKHSGGEYEYKEVMTDVCFIAEAANNQISMLMNVVSSPVTVGQCGLAQFYDNEWDATLITISGGTTGQSFVFDSVMCLEYAPSATSSIYPLAKHGNTPKPQVMQQAEKLAGDQPVSSPGAFDTMVTIAGVVGKLALG